MTTKGFPAVEAQAAYHEAGHAVATVYYRRGQTSKIVLREPPNPSFTEATTGNTFRIFRQKRNAPDSFIVNSRPIEQFILGFLAGSAAERRFSWEQGFRPLEGSDMEDRKLIKGWAIRLPAKKRRQTLSRLEREIEALFDRPSVWAATQSLADHLLMIRRIDGLLARTIIKYYLGRKLSRIERNRAPSLMLARKDLEKRQNNKMPPHKLAPAGGCGPPLA